MNDKNSIHSLNWPIFRPWNRAHNDTIPFIALALDCNVERKTFTIVWRKDKSTTRQIVKTIEHSNTKARGRKVKINANNKSNRNFNAIFISWTLFPFILCRVSGLRFIFRQTTHSANVKPLAQYQLADVYF